MTSFTKRSYHKFIIFLLLVICVVFFFLSSSITITQKHAPEPLVKNVYVYASQWGPMFDVGNPANNRDNCLQPLWQLYESAEKEGYHLQQINSLDGLQDFEYLLVFEVPEQEIDKLIQYPTEKLILFLWEPPSVLPNNYHFTYHQYFSKIYTWNDHLVDQVKYFKFYYPVLNTFQPSSIPFEEKKLCTLIACNKHSSHPQELYSKRLEIIHFFENQHPMEFDLYGKWWPNNFKTYQGGVETKADVIKKYRFCFAYENIKDIPGYITEKIFDCFQAGAIPIYWGASNVENYIPRTCFIDQRDFSNPQEIYDYLVTIDEKAYNSYLAHIQKFLVSKQAHLFSNDHFVNTILELIKENPMKN